MIAGLIDLRFHIENDPKMALRQLSHGSPRSAIRGSGTTSSLSCAARSRRTACRGRASSRQARTSTARTPRTPRIPSSRAMSRRHAATPSARCSRGATALKIYFCLPFASAKAVIDVCHASRIPCTAHLELLDAREVIAAGLHGIEHITSFGVSLLPRHAAETCRRAVLKDNDARRDGRYRLFAEQTWMAPMPARSTPFCASAGRGSTRRSRRSNGAPIVFRREPS